VALEAYFRVAKDPEPERQACEIRLRAERRAGVLLKDRDKAQGKRTDLVPQGKQVDDRPTLADMGVTGKQSMQWQQLADVPEEQFEAALAAPDGGP